MLHKITIKWASCTLMLKKCCRCLSASVSVDFPAITTYFGCWSGEQVSLCTSEWIGMDTRDYVLPNCRDICTATTNKKLPNHGLHCQQAPSGNSPSLMFINHHQWTELRALKLFASYLCLWPKHSLAGAQVDKVIGAEIGKFFELNLKTLNLPGVYIGTVLTVVTWNHPINFPKEVEEALSLE